MAPPGLPEMGTVLPQEYVALILPPTSLSLLRSLVGNIIPVPDPQHDITTVTAHARDGALPVQQKTCLELSRPQLVMLENTPIAIGDILSSSDPPGHGASVRARHAQKVRVACIHCRDAAKRCDSGRPCALCLRMHLSGCEDAPTKRGNVASRRNDTGAALFHHVPTAGPSTSMVAPAHHAPQIHLGQATPATPSAAAIYGGTGVPYLSPVQPSNGARWSEAHVGTSTFDSDIIMPQDPYTYGDPYSAQGQIAFVQPTMPTVAPLPPAAGYANVTRLPAGVLAFPWCSPEHTVTPWSNDNEATSAQLEGHEMHSSSHSSATDPRFY